MKIEEAVDHMNKTIMQLRESIIGVHSGTISPGLINAVKVNYYDQLTPVKQLASVSKVKSGISIIVYDLAMVGSTVTALKNAGFNAYVFSKNTVMVPVEPPSGDQKLEVISHLKKLGEDAKISIRNLRRKVKQKLNLPEDEQREVEKSLQTHTDQAINLIDETIVNKIGAL